MVTDGEDPSPSFSPRLGKTAAGRRPLPEEGWDLDDPDGRTSTCVDVVYELESRNNEAHAPRRA